MTGRYIIHLMYDIVHGISTLLNLIEGFRRSCLILHQKNKQKQTRSKNFLSDQRAKIHLLLLHHKK